jgi:hypothetical protein
VKDIPAAYIERLRDGATSSPVFGDGSALEYLNTMLEKRGFSKVDTGEPEEISLDDIPF